MDFLFLSQADSSHYMYIFLMMQIFRYFMD